MAERRREFSDYKGWVTLKLNFRLKSCFSRQYLWTVRWGNNYTTTLLLEVFTQKTFSTLYNLYSIKIVFYLKKTKNRF